MVDYLVFYDKTFHPLFIICSQNVPNFHFMVKTFVYENVPVLMYTFELQLQCDNDIKRKNYDVCLLMKFCAICSSYMTAQPITAQSCMECRHFKLFGLLLGYIPVTVVSIALNKSPAHK